MKRVTEDEIKQMNELYLQYRTYSAVAKEVGRAASTVKKYIDPNYQINEVPKELEPVNWDILLSAPSVDVKKGEWDNERFLS